MRDDPGSSREGLKTRGPFGSLSLTRRLVYTLILLGLGLIACPSDPRPREGLDASPGTEIQPQGSDAGVASTLGDSDGTEQLPPTTGRAGVRAWLAAGPWRRWRCEARAHPGSGLSPHGLNRICNNDVLVGAPAGAPWPVGAASVKVLYNPRAPDDVIGYGLYLKVREGTDGSNWFWFEVVRPDFVLDPSPPRESDGTIAEGLGDRGGAQAICVNCHRRSGSHEAGVTGPGDFVYTRLAAP